jgi:hypothetical protein
MHLSRSGDVSMQVQLTVPNNTDPSALWFVLILLWIAIRVHLGFLELCMNLQQNRILRILATDVRRTVRCQPIHQSV